MTTRDFAELGLSEDVLKAIQRLGFEQASPIQAEAIPIIMEGRDVVGQSQTGSGKTAAFAAPAIERVDTKLRAVQALILCPTRELAVQVSEEVHKLAFFKRGIHALPIYGGQSYDRQMYGLKQGAQIVIGTPGRVMDHMRRGTLRLDQLKMAVLDEADVMLDMGFRDDIEFILQASPKERQTIFFSATMPRPIQELIQKYAREPQSVRIEQKTMTVPTVEQTYYEVDRRFKVELLTRLIDLHDLKLGIIFCNTKRMVDDLVEHLNAQGYSADRLHGDMGQALRDRVMNRFRKSGLEFLVATDVAARGIDVDDVQVVFNYDLPYDVEDYVHRIGRTGRAGRSGLAISFAAGREVFQIRQIERYTNTRIHRAKVPSLTEVEQARASAFLGKLRVTLQSGEFQRQDQLVEILLEEGFSSTDIASALMHMLQGQNQGQDSRPSGREESDNRGERWERREPRHDDDRRERPPLRERPERTPARERAERRPLLERPARSMAREQREARPERRPAAPPPAPAPPGPVPPATETRPAPAAAEQPAPAAEAKIQPSPSPEPAKPAAPAEIQEGRALLEQIRRRFGPEEADQPAAAAEPPKPSRRTPPGHSRVHLNVGGEMGVSAENLKRFIQGQTGLGSSEFAGFDVRERYSFVDLKSEHASGVVAKLKRAEFAGRRLKVRIAKIGDTSDAS
jgi:ATP-dependent RNA helicase DeaD